MPQRRFTGLPAPLGASVAGKTRPLVLSDEEQLRQAIEASIDDEGGAEVTYQRIASDAGEMGFEDIATVFRNAAEDERRHNKEFRKALEKLD